MGTVKQVSPRNFGYKWEERSLVRREYMKKARHWENWKVKCKIMKLEHSLNSFTKLILKWIKNLNVKT